MNRKKNLHRNTTLEVSDEDEDLGSNNQGRGDFTCDLNRECLSQAKSVSKYDVVRKHAVSTCNGVPTSAVPAAVKVNQTQLVNSIYNQ